MAAIIFNGLGLQDILRVETDAFILIEKEYSFQYINYYGGKGV